MLFFVDFLEFDVSTTTSIVLALLIAYIITGGTVKPLRIVPIGVNCLREYLLSYLLTARMDDVLLLCHEFTV